MKSKRVGGARSMHLISGVPRGLLPLVQHAQPELSREARKRLKWFDYYRAHEHNASLTCRHFDISRQTFYRWKRRFHPGAHATLENRSCTPKHGRHRTWTTDEILAVQHVRTSLASCTWGKAKIQVVLARDGCMLSVSRVGRILGYLKRRGLLHQPVSRPGLIRRHLHPRPYAVRKPRGYPVLSPGDLVQLDTLDIRPLPGRVLKQFTAYDVISRWTIADLHDRATARTARDALQAVLDRMPFRVKAIQIDGGSEFMGEFESACRELGLLLFVLPPRSPKLNGGVERANRTYTDEFWRCHPMRTRVPDLVPQLLDWEWHYNTVRPHQGIRFLTPLQLLQRYHPKSIRLGALLPRLLSPRY